MQLVKEDPILISKLFNNYFVKIDQSITNKITNLFNLDFSFYLKNPVFTNYKVHCVKLA